MGIDKLSIVFYNSSGNLSLFDVFSCHASYQVICRQEERVSRSRKLNLFQSKLSCDNVIREKCVVMLSAVFQFAKDLL